MQGYERPLVSHGGSTSISRSRRKIISILDTISATVSFRKLMNFLVYTVLYPEQLTFTNPSLLSPVTI